MTKLPATILEAEALQWTREAVAELCKPGGIFAEDGRIRYGREAMKFWALAHPFGADDIVYFAENGSKDADAALREIIAEKIDKHEPMGAVLEAYNIRLINPSREPRQHGPGRADNFVREIGIVCLITALRDRFGLAPTWNRKARKPAASMILAAVLTKAGIVSLSYKGIEKVRKRYLPALAGTRYAEKSRFALGIPAGYGGIFAD